MSEQSETELNKAVIRRFVEEVQNQKNWAAFDELNADDFVNLSAPRRRRPRTWGPYLALRVYAAASKKREDASVGELARIGRSGARVRA